MGAPFWDAIADEDLDKGRAPNDPWADDQKRYTPWDVLWLNGWAFPGVVEIRAVPRMRVDSYHASGEDGGLIIERGHESAELDIRLKLWTAAHWQQFQELLRLVWRTPGQRVPIKETTGIITGGKAIDIDHPACQPLGVTAVIIESVESAEPGPERGSRVVRFKCLQYIPPNPQVVTNQKKGSGPLQNVDPIVAKIRNSVGEDPATTDGTAKDSPEPGGGTE